MNVYAAITACQRDLSVAGIAKDKTNSYDGYQFRGIDDVYNALGPILAKNGLVILPRVVSRDCTERPTRNNTVQFHAVLTVEYDFISSTATGEEAAKHTIVSYGEATDRGDKATPKALAAAYKYMAIQTFCIPVDGADDADHSTADEMQARPPAPARPDARQQATAPAALKTQPAVISPQQSQWIKKELEAAQCDVKAFCAEFGVTAVDELKPKQLPKVKEIVTTWRAASKVDIPTEPQTAA